MPRGNFGSRFILPAAFCLLPSAFRLLTSDSCLLNSLRSLFQLRAQPDPLGMNLVAASPLAGNGLKGAEQFGCPAAEEFEIVAGVVGLFEMGGDVEQRPFQ